MPLRTVRKIALYVLYFLSICGGGLLLCALLPTPWTTVASLTWLALMTLLVLYVLDMMVPGVNVFSFAPTRLPERFADTVALTFDDGPVEPYTREILDILDQYNAKATFFCLGENVEQNPALAKEIVERGHSIGNHTFGHRILPLLSKDASESEIDKGFEVIKKTTGQETFLIRCPKGYKSRRIAQSVKRRAAHLIGFSYPIYDVQNPPPEQLIHRLLSRVQGRDILLMHDGYAPGCQGRRDSLVKALPKILEGIKEKKLQLVTIDQAFGPASPVGH